VSDEEGQLPSDENGNPLGDEGKLLGDVRDWLERGGYVLEMRVALMLRAHTNILSQGYTYTDPTTGREREADVWGVVFLVEVEGHTHAVTLVIECKQTQAPWIAFKSHGGLNGPVTLWDCYDDDCPGCSGIDEDLYTLMRTVPNAYAITEKRTKEKQLGQGHNGKDHAYEAVQQAANVFLSGKPQKPADQGQEGHPDPVRVTGITIPMVVTTSPLVLAHLDAGTGEIVLEEVDRVNVMVSRAGLDDAEGIEVLVVRLDALGVVLDEIAKLGLSTPSR
jgi:hypothetical protein